MIKTPNAGSGILFKGFMDSSGQLERTRTVTGVEWFLSRSLEQVQFVRWAQEVIVQH